MKPLGLSSSGLARFCSTDVQSWMNLQTHYAIQCAKDIAGHAIKRIAPPRDEASLAQGR
jgi:plasmid maintenance system antidote protein VapI